MKSLLVMALAFGLAIAVATAQIRHVPDESSTAAAEAAVAGQLSRRFDSEPKFRCLRSEGDHTVANLVADIDYICNPVKQERGLSPGYVVDLRQDRIVDFRGFGV